MEKFFSFGTFGNSFPCINPCFKEVFFTWSLSFKSFQIANYNCIQSHCSSLSRWIMGPTFSACRAKWRGAFMDWPFMSIMGLVWAQLGLPWVYIKLRICETQFRPIQVSIWAHMLNWAPLKMDLKPIVPIKSIQITQGLIKHRIDEIWTICSCISRRVHISAEFLTFSYLVECGMPWFQSSTKVNNLILPLC